MERGPNLNDPRFKKYLEKLDPKYRKMLEDIYAPQQPSMTMEEIRKLVKRAERNPNYGTEGG